MKISRLYLNLLSWSGPRFSGAKVISIKFWSFITTAVPTALVQNSAHPWLRLKKTNQIRGLYQQKRLKKVIQPVKKNVLPALYLSVFCSYEIRFRLTSRGETPKSNIFPTKAGPLSRQKAGEGPGNSIVSPVWRRLAALTRPLHKYAGSAPDRCRCAHRWQSYRAPPACRSECRYPDLSDRSRAVGS